MALEIVQPIFSSFRRTETVSSKRADLKIQLQLKKTNDLTLLIMTIKDGLTIRPNMKAI